MNRLEKRVRAYLKARNVDYVTIVRPIGGCEWPVDHYHFVFIQDEEGFPFPVYRWSVKGNELYYRVGLSAPAVMRGKINAIMQRFESIIDMSLRGV